MRLIRLYHANAGDAKICRLCALLPYVAHILTLVE
eukprot:COSAG05_NODE_1616_length_4398_cov_23.434520_2_plen_35_part_00